jgi:hypothetical protein
MRGILFIAAIALVGLPAVAQESPAECERRMKRCWIANDGDRNAKTVKSVNEYCSTKSVCGWQTDLQFKDFVCPRGEEARCEPAKRSVSEKLLRSPRPDTRCDPRTQRC